MKTKLEMAHDYAMLHMMNTQYKDVDDLEMVQWAFDYADAMQAEADKREKEQQSEHVFEAIEEWQPDWSQAPYWANWWAMDEDRKCHWFSKEPWSHNGASEWVLENNGEGLNNIYSPSIHCGYTGDWRNSLRKRPK